MSTKMSIKGKEKALHPKVQGKSQFVLIFPIIQNRKKANILAITMLAPVGVSRRTDASIPKTKHTTETIPEHTTTLLNVLQMRMEVRAGKITRLDIKSAPISLMPRTIITAVSTATRALYTEVRVPVALEKFSSKVTAKILL